MRGREDFLDPQALHAAPKRLAVDLVVAVAEEIGWRGVVREGVHDLLGGPVGGGMLGDGRRRTRRRWGEHDEDEEDAQAGGGNGEEIDGDQVPDVIARNVRQV